jgi:hypothetical protein
MRWTPLNFFFSNNAFSKDIYQTQPGVSLLTPYKVFLGRVQCLYFVRGKEKNLVWTNLFLPHTLTFSSIIVSISIPIPILIPSSPLNSQHIRIWKSSADTVLLIWTIRSSICDYILTIINNLIHQNLCLNLSTIIVISLNHYDFRVKIGQFYILPFIQKFWNKIPSLLNCSTKCPYVPYFSIFSFSSPLQCFIYFFHLVSFI